LNWLLSALAEKAFVKRQTSTVRLYGIAKENTAVEVCGSPLAPTTFKKSYYSLLHSHNQDHCVLHYNHTPHFK